MADKFTFELKGAQVLDRQLNRLSEKAGKRVLIAGLRAGAAVVKKEAKRRAPRRSKGDDRIITLGRNSSRVRAPGFLSRTIIYRRQGRALILEVGPRKAAFYGRFFEDGVSGRRFPHRAWFSSAFRASQSTAVAKISAAVWVQLKKEVDRRG